MGLHRQPDWQRALGQYVEVRRRGRTVRTGVVDAVTSDGSLLWISAEGAHLREMVERADGSEIYSRYSWDAPPQFEQMNPFSLPTMSFIEQDEADPH